MSEEEQISALADDLDALVGRYRDEFDLSVAAVIGVLQFKAFLVMCHAREYEEEDGD